MTSMVNVKIIHKDKIKKRDGVESLDHLYQVIRELFNVNPKQYTLTYSDNEGDTVIINSQKCYESAVCAVNNSIYYKHDAIKPSCDNNDIRQKLVLLKLKIDINDAEKKYDDDDEVINNVPYKPFKFSWDSKMKGSRIDLSENDMKSQQRDGQFHAVRSTSPIPKGMVSQWILTVFMTSSSGYFYGLISSEVTQGHLERAWYNIGEKIDIYGVDDNPGCVYKGAKRETPKWTRPTIPNSKEIKLRLTADYTRNCCHLCVEMLVDKDKDYQWVYQLLLPPVKEWYPAVQFEDPKAWARIN